jgi:hypothetical protein
VPTSIVKLLDWSPELAVNVANCGVLVADTVALKLARFAPAAIVTAAGTETAALLLDTFTVRPLLLAAVFRLTVQRSVPDPVMTPFAQVNPLTVGTPVPERATCRGRLSEEVLVNVSSPDAAPATVGSNCTFTLAVSPAFSVRGKVAPEAMNPVPVSVALFTVTDDMPVEDKVSVCVASVLTSTLPKLTLDALTVRMDAAACSCIEKLCAVSPASAVRMTVCAAGTAVIIALKFALVAPAGIVTVAGTLTAALLLLSATVNPPLPAAEPSVTVHGSVSEPITVPFAQFNKLNVPRGAAVVPVPDRLTTSEFALVASLETVNVPEANPIAEGLN